MRQIYGPNGAVIGTVSSSGTVTSEDSGIPLGLIRNDECFADAIGAQRLGFVDPDGRVIDNDHAVVGKVDATGTVRDAAGRAWGKVEEPRDAAALLFILKREEISGTSMPTIGQTSVTDEFLDQMDSSEEKEPHVKRNYRPLTDDDVYGRPKN